MRRGTGPRRAPGAALAPDPAPDAPRSHHYAVARAAWQGARPRGGPARRTHPATLPLPARSHVMTPTLLARARHEIAHAAYASACGLTVARVSLTPDETNVHWKTPLPGLGLLWANNPALATWRTIQTASVLLAPYVSGTERFQGSHDQEALRGWQTIWQGLQTVRHRQRLLPWREIVSLAWQDVETWSQRPGAGEALDHLSHLLARQPWLNAQRWATLWRSRLARPLWQ